MSREIKFKFVIDDKFVTRAYTLDELINITGDDIFEDAEERFNPCTCNMGESWSSCECNTIFDNSRITGKLQSTGLCDKNGKEIYEGDIVNCADTNPTILEVKFIEGGFCCTSSNILPFDINSFYPSIGCRIEVIGNIYENPELLEVQE